MKFIGTLTAMMRLGTFPSLANTYTHMKSATSLLPAKLLRYESSRTPSLLMVSSLPTTSLSFDGRYFSILQQGD